MLLHRYVNLASIYRTKSWQIHENRVPSHRLVWLLILPDLYMDYCNILYNVMVIGIHQSANSCAPVIKWQHPFINVICAFTFLSDSIFFHCQKWLNYPKQWAPSSLGTALHLCSIVTLSGPPNPILLLSLLLTILFSHLFAFDRKYNKSDNELKFVWLWNPSVPGRLVVEYTDTFSLQA